MDGAEGSVNLTAPPSMMAEDAGHVTSRCVTVKVTVRGPCAARDVA